MDNLHVRLTFNLGKKNKSFTTVKKSILKLVELPSLVAKCCKTWKIYSSSAKFANFVLREEKVFELKLSQKTFSSRKTNIYKI